MNLPPTTKSVKLSQQLLLAVRKKEPILGGLKELANISPQKLLAELPDDAHKLAFWINCYNTFIQTELRMQEGTPSTSGDFFTAKRLHIAGQRLSFDDIEHGIIRGGKAKYGLGWLPSFWFSSFVKQHKVQKPDWRIHFALNCGAKSCPPIAFYQVATLNDDLEMATRNYLEQDTIYDKGSNIVYVTKLMFWFMGDFGGYTGIRKILSRYKIIPEGQKPKIKFKDYDWSILADNYR